MKLLRIYSVYRVQMFRDNWNCYALTIIPDFILLALSDNNKPYVKEAKKCKQWFAYNLSIGASLGVRREEIWDLKGEGERERKLSLSPRFASLFSFPLPPLPARVYHS